LRPTLKLPQYPRQFWLLLGGYFISQVGSSLIWPFLTVFMREQLNEPFTTITLLFSIQTVAALAATSVVGSLMDRFGRKGIMVIGLLANAAVMLAMSQAFRLEQWVILSACYGAIVPTFGVGSNAMVADLVEEGRRVQAYALLRMTSNLGLAFGSAAGGLLARHTGISYSVTAAVYVLLAMLVIAFLSESLARNRGAMPENGGSYRTLVRDRMFMAIFALCSLVAMGAVLVFRLMSVYMKEGYGLAEDQFGLIVMVNAVMVVLFQYGVTRISAHFRPLPVLALGAFLYAVGVGSVAAGSTFLAFATSMAIATAGELLVAPTSTALVANLAPPDMRARYMGIFSLTYMIAGGIGPVMGGFLADHVGPSAIWIGGMVVNLAATLGFLIMARLSQQQSLMEPAATIAVGQK
jgi:predicted MFS family arabinose efflux permease